MQPAAGFPAPAAHCQYQPPAGQWSSDLCACFSDVESCITTYVCPCVAFGRIAEIVDKGGSSCCGSGCCYACLCCLTLSTGLLCYCNWLYSCTYRSKIKQQYGIPASCCEDCCTHFWCEYCALCQEYRELQHRGYLPALGWQANMQRQNAGLAMTNAPVVPNGMMK
ncbi:hypothetical protein Ancab_004828 [Ancistrocladus abbreviatus]